MGIDRQFIVIGLVLVCAFLLFAVFVAMPRMVAADKRRTWRNIQSSAVGPAEELFHPAAYRANILRQSQSEVPATAAVPGDDGFLDGRIVINADHARATGRSHMGDAEP